MLASFIITKVAENCYYFITSSDIVEKIIPRLKMFVLRAKVVIEKLSDESVYFCDTAQYFGINIAFDSKHYLNIAPSQDVTSDDISLWKNWLITSGIPQIYLATQEVFTPQQVNYDLINGVNFKKGCYTGQEIVARMHYLGKVKRRMYRYFCLSKIEIGQLIYSPIMDNQVVGEVVEALAINSQYIGLVSVQPNCIADAFLDIENTQQITITEL